MMDVCGATVTQRITASRKAQASKYKICVSTISSRLVPSIWHRFQNLSVHLHNQFAIIHAYQF